MIHPTAIDHVSLLIRSAAATQAYYERLFDFTCTLHPDDASILQIESPTVHFFMLESKDAPTEFLRQQHISLEVADLAQVVTLLDTAGEIYETGEFRGFRHRNYRWCEWRDPNGIRLECVERIAEPFPKEPHNTRDSQ